MPTASELVNAGYTGYQGWGDAEANADFKATSGAGKFPQGGGSSGGGGGYTPISAPDLAKIRTDIAGIIHPYYQKLAAQANGNFDEAIKLMQADYSSGVKKAKEDFAYAEKYGTGELNNALSSLGVDFTKENESNIDSLNKRGIATYEGEGNVVKPGTFNPSFDPSALTFNAGVSGTNPNMSNLGRGGFEAEQLRKDQALRAEATMRAGMKPLEGAGLTLKRTTSADGFDPNKPLNYTGDYSSLGTEERNLASSYRTQKNDLVSNLQQLPQQEAQTVNNLAGDFASTSTKGIDETARNQIQKQYNTDFVQGGF